MPDPYANIAEIPEETAAMLAGVLETRAQELEMVAMRSTRSNQKLSPRARQASATASMSFAARAGTGT